MRVCYSPVTRIVTVFALFVLFASACVRRGCCLCCLCSVVRECVCVCGTRFEMCPLRGRSVDRRVWHTFATLPLFARTQRVQLRTTMSANPHFSPLTRTLLAYYRTLHLARGEITRLDSTPREAYNFRILFIFWSNVCCRTWKTRKKLRQFCLNLQFSVPKNWQLPKSNHALRPDLALVDLDLRKYLWGRLSHTIKSHVALIHSVRTTRAP